MKSLLFGTSFAFVVGALVAYGWGGVPAVFAVLLLAALEVSLSFDNAVVNAVVLSRMSKVWQQRFLTWGIPVAVFGTRFLFPLFIVALVASLSPFEVLRLAFFDGSAYGAHLGEAHVAISSFGGMFLLMVFLSFFLNHEKRVHWAGTLERTVARLGKVESSPVIVAGIFLVSFSLLLGNATGLTVLKSGLCGLISFIAITGFTAFLEGREKKMIAGQAGLSLFIYLQFLDASFSLDSVIGAFAINSDVVIIALGLGIGAYAVRSLTLFFVRRGTLSEYLYLEHGAHYAIGALAILMLLSVRFHIPETVIGTIGIIFIGASLLSSILEKRK